MSRFLDWVMGYTSTGAIARINYIYYENENLRKFVEKNYTEPHLSKILQKIDAIKEITIELRNIIGVSPKYYKTGRL